MNAIDPIRHIEVFSPHSFGDRRVDIIGVGATGSRICLSLAKLGIKNIHVWDDDKVEPHNVPNQAFGHDHCGRLKVEALRDIVLEQTGTEIAVHPQRVSGTEIFGPIVFLLTDTMSSRKLIWDGAIKYRPEIELMIETRMGPSSGRVYAINPSLPVEVDGWEGTLYGDDVAEVSACGASISVGPTAETVSGIAVWQLIRWHQRAEKMARGEACDDEIEHETVFSLQPMMIATSCFA